MTIHDEHSLIPSRKIRYNNRHKDVTGQYRRDYQNEIRKLWWGNVQPTTDRKLIGKEIEYYAKEKLLPCLGFNEIVHFSEIYPYFAFDFLAVRDQRKCLIDATCGKIATKLQRPYQLAEIFQADFFILIIKPDKTFHKLFKIEKNQDYVVINTSEIHELAKSPIVWCGKRRILPNYFKRNNR